MKEIIFNQSHQEDISVTNSKPVVFISRIQYVSNNPDWTSRLSQVQLMLVCEALDANENVMGASTMPYSVGSLISPYHTTPLFEPEYFEDFSNLNVADISGHIEVWRLKLYLTGIDFEEDEAIEVHIMEKDYISKRVDDWVERIDALYQTIRDWSADLENSSIIDGDPMFMREKLMVDFGLEPRQVNSLKVSINSDLKFVFRPKGLWVMGANGRIDILTPNGPRILVDFAENFQEPIWKIYSQDRHTSTPLTQETFNSLLNTSAT